MRNLTIIAAGALFGFTLAAQASEVDGIGVVVDTSVITYSEIEEAVTPRLETAAKVYANDPQKFQDEAEKARAQQIEALVERKLIVHEFSSGGYSTNFLDAFIDDRIRDKIQKSFYGDRARMIKTLQAEGMTYEMLREREREDLIVEIMSYQNVSTKKIIISPLKIETYYNQHKDDFNVNDQVHVKMIQVNQSPDSPPGAARKVAEEILQKIDNGVSFSEMAGVYSSGSQRSEGGDRGWVDRSYFKPELADVAFSLKPGQHSGVIELPEACYLLMVEDTRAAHVRPLAEVRFEIERLLRSQESLRLEKNWIDRLKKKFRVQFF